MDTLGIYRMLDKYEEVIGKTITDELESSILNVEDGLCYAIMLMTDLIKIANNNAELVDRLVEINDGLEETKGSLY